MANLIIKTCYANRGEYRHIKISSLKLTLNGTANETTDSLKSVLCNQYKLSSNYQLIHPLELEVFWRDTTVDDMSGFAAGQFPAGATQIKKIRDDEELRELLYFLKKNAVASAVSSDTSTVQYEYCHKLGELVFGFCRVKRNAAKTLQQEQQQQQVCGSDECVRAKRSKDSEIMLRVSELSGNKSVDSGYMSNNSSLVSNWAQTETTNTSTVATHNYRAGEIECTIPELVGNQMSCRTCNKLIPHTDLAFVCLSCCALPNRSAATSSIPSTTSTHSNNGNNGGAYKRRSISEYSLASNAFGGVAASLCYACATELRPNYANRGGCTLDHLLLMVPKRCLDFTHGFARCLFRMIPRLLPYNLVKERFQQPQLISPIVVPQARPDENTDKTDRMDEDDDDNDTIKKPISPALIQDTVNKKEVCIDSRRKEKEIIQTSGFTDGAAQRIARTKKEAVADASQL